MGAIPVSLTIPAGQTSTSVTIASLQDATFEADETFTLAASLAAQTREASATILNDDAAASTTLGGIAILDVAPSLQGSVAAPVATNSINLTRIGGVLSPGGAGAAESLAFDPVSARVYVTNAALDRIDVYSLGDPRTPTLAGGIDLRASLGDFPYGEVNSVAVRGQLLAVAVQSADGGEPGIVALYDGYTGALIKTITVGVLPDQVTFSRDGSLAAGRQ
jgi:hypothetical protein